MNVSYTDFGTVQWGHSGAFASGAATAVYLLPGAGFGVLALTNGAPVGAPEALCLSVLDLAQRGNATRDWLETITPLLPLWRRRRTARARTGSPRRQERRRRSPTPSTWGPIGTTFTEPSR